MVKRLKEFLGISTIKVGGLNALQTAAIASGFPFALLMIGMCFALFKELRNEV